MTHRDKKKIVLNAQAHIHKHDALQMVPSSADPVQGRGKQFPVVRADHAIRLLIRRIAFGEVLS